MNPYGDAARTMLKACPHFATFVSEEELAQFLREFVHDFRPDVDEAADLLTTGLLFHIGSRHDGPLDLDLAALQKASRAVLRDLEHLPA